MQHFSPIYYLAVIVIAALVSQSEAKRGCALYGHSCYGGHGKRSDVPRDLLSLETPQEKPYAINKEIIYPMNIDMNDANQLDLNNDNRLKSRNELNYAIYNLVRRWINFAKKGSDEVQQAPEADTIFKNTYV